MNKTVKYSIKFALATILVFGVISLAPLVINNIASTPSSEQSSEYGEDTVFADGDYVGSANGFRPTITVKVSLSSGIITAVSVLDHDESMDRDEPPVALEEIPDTFVGVRAIDVLREVYTLEIITGATRTSNGILNAVADAIQKAIVA